jgi:hypothetical protein
VTDKIILAVLTFIERYGTMDDKPGCCSHIWVSKRFALRLCMSQGTDAYLLWGGHDEELGDLTPCPGKVLFKLELSEEYQEKMYG